MSGFIIFPVTKSPHSRGRFGPKSLQDWYRGLEKTKILSSVFSPSKVVIISDLRIDGESEADIYIEACRNLDIQHVEVIRSGHETIEQVEIVTELMKKEDSELVVISTFFHYLRVRWLFRGTKAQFYVVFGIPRPYEVFTDIVLTIVFPVLDLLGLRKFFQDKIQGRRKSGKF